jgi:hypothetical protein
MNINKNKLYNNSNYVSAGIIRFSLLGINKIKSVLPLNLPRVNKDYLVGFIDSHKIQSKFFSNEVGYNKKKTSIVSETGFKQNLRILKDNYSLKELSSYKKENENELLKIFTLTKVKELKEDCLEIHNKIDHLCDYIINESPLFKDEKYFNKFIDLYQSINLRCFILSGPDKSVEVKPFNVFEISLFNGVEIKDNSNTLNYEKLTNFLKSGELKTFFGNKNLNCKVSNSETFVIMFVVRARNGSLETCTRMLCESDKQFLIKITTFLRLFQNPFLTFK